MDANRCGNVRAVEEPTVWKKYQISNRSRLFVFSLSLAFSIAFYIHTVLFTFLGLCVEFYLITQHQSNDESVHRSE